MDYKQLVKEAIKLLDCYKPKTYDVDPLMEDSFKTLKIPPSDEQKFIKDIVHGCIVHQKLLDIVIKVFYDQKGKLLLKADWNQFVVIAYLAMFHLDVMGLEQFSTVIKSLDISKMHKIWFMDGCSEIGIHCSINEAAKQAQNHNTITTVFQFLSFFFNVTNLTTWIFGEWSQIYDVTFVERKWIAPLLSWQTGISRLLNELERKTKQKTMPKNCLKKQTRHQEFDLTKPKPRSLPAPELIPQLEKHKPAPVSTHRPPTELQVLEDIKQKNQLKSQEVLYEANTQKFRCANPEKTKKTKSIMSQIKQNLDAKLKFDTVYSSGTPATRKTNKFPIRLNTTAILREGVVYNRQKDEELYKLEQLTQGGSEPSAFLQWQKEMREKDLQEQLAQLECKRLQGKISYEEALLARQRVIEDNQHKALLKKEETAELMRIYAEKRLQEEKEMKELVQQVAESHKNSKAAKVKLQELKKQIVKEVSEQSQELLRQALEKAQAELSQKFVFIQQIRAIESVSHLNQKFWDDTETGGHEVLCEMSLAELRERLARAKKEEQLEQDKRRQKVLLEKQSKEQFLLEELENIAACRAAAGFETAQNMKAEEKMRQNLEKAVSMDEQVVALQKILETKQQERQMKETSGKNKNKTTKQEAAQKASEEQNWLQVEQILEKQVQKRESGKILWA